MIFYLPTTEGNMLLGKASPAKPAFVFCDPMSKTTPLLWVSWEDIFVDLKFCYFTDQSWPPRFALKTVTNTSSIANWIQSFCTHCAGGVQHYKIDSNLYWYLGSHMNLFLRFMNLGLDFSLDLYNWEDIIVSFLLF